MFLRDKVLMNQEPNIRLMLQKNELKVGLVIWWTRSSEGWGGDWNCPCIFTHVDIEGNKYRVFSFDDFKETGDLQIEMPTPNGSNSSSLSEMKLSSMEEVKAFLQKEKASAEEKVSKLRKKVEEAESKLALYDKDPLDIVRSKSKGSQGEVVNL